MNAFGIVLQLRFHESFGTKQEAALSKIDHIMAKTNETLVIRRKRVSFQAWHRGTREMDFIFGGYADTHLDTMDNETLDQFEALMEVDDQTLYRWISGALDVPAEFATDIMATLQKMRFTQRDFV